MKVENVYIGDICKLTDLTIDKNLAVEKVKSTLFYKKGEKLVDLNDKESYNRVVKDLKINERYVDLMSLVPLRLIANFTRKNLSKKKIKEIGNKLINR